MQAKRIIGETPSKLLARRLKNISSFTAVAAECGGLRDSLSIGRAGEQKIMRGENLQAIQSKRYEFTDSYNLLK